MEDQVIDIYEKYANLFSIRLTPKIEKVYQIPYKESAKHPIVVRNGQDTCLTITGNDQQNNVVPDAYQVRNIIKSALVSKVKAIPKLKLDSFKMQLIDTTSAIREYGDRTAVVYRGCEFRIINIGSEFFLCLDYNIKVKNHLMVDEIARLLPNYDFKSHKGFYKTEDGWEPARIDYVEGDDVNILVSDETMKVRTNQFLPDIPAIEISKILQRKGIKSNFNQELKNFSLLTVSNAPLQRLQKNLDIADTLARSVFPIKIGNHTIAIDPNPVKLMSPVFDVRDDLIEPYSAFHHEDETKKSQKILDGLMQFGSFDKPKKELSIVILCTSTVKGLIKALLDKITQGQYRYHGMEKTFGARIKIMASIETQSVDEYLDQCKTFVQRPDFLEADIFFVYIPQDIGRSSYSSPYYEVKKFLLQNGIPSQMVARETLNNPEWKEMNIGLNLFAKTGNTPWVLDEEMKDADLFIGTSYSAIKRYGKVERMMAYVNVFDKFGRWKFYQGGVEAFPYEERHKRYREIVRTSIQRYLNENPGIELKKIHIHYTQKLKRDDRFAIIDEINELLPDCEAIFVYINSDTPIRLFDKTSPDGSIHRGTYVVTSKNSFWIATTGQNQLNQKGMGTPKIFEVTVFSKEGVDLKNIAQHILCLTKLNWASVKAFCHEPITIKYAGQIAYLMNVFMKDPNFSTSERIRNKPWFL